MKKIICIVLMLCLFLSVIANASLPVPDSEVSAQSDILAALNIAEESSQGEYVSRADFAHIVYKLVNMKDMGIRIENIADMSFEDPRIICISNILATGWMTLDDGNCFRPDDIMTGTEMLKVLLCVLGYYNIAMENGGYPAGILNYAAKIKLTADISDDISKELSRDNMYILLRNALNIDMMERQYTQSEEKYEIIKGKTLLRENHHITEHASARYTANNKFNLEVTGDTVPEDTVKIGTNTFYAGEYAEQLTPGACYIVYSSYENEHDAFETIRYIEQDSGVEIINICADDIMDSTTASQLVYSIDNNGREREKKVDLNKVNIVFNGEELFTYQKQDLIPEVGDISIVTENGRCTTLVISSYDTKIVKTVSTEFEKIYFDYSGGAVDYGKEEFNIYFKDEKIEPDELQGMDIALVAHAKSGFVNEMVISRGTTEGTIDSVDSNGNYHIGDAEYKLSAHVYDYGDNYNPGSKIKFITDAYGNIAYMKRTDSDNYAFLVGAKELSGFSGEYVLRLFAPDGSLGEYKLDDKTIFNGYKIGAQQILNSLLKADGSLDYQLLKIKHNSEHVLKSIETAYDNISGEYTHRFSKDLTTERKQWRYYNQFLSNGEDLYHLKNDSLVFSVFVDEDGRIYEDSLLVSDVNTEFINYKVYDDVVLYDIDDKENAPKVIVNYLSAPKYVTTVTNQKGLIVIDSIGKALTGDGEVVNNVNYYLNGVRQEIAVSDEVENVAVYDSTTYDVPDVYKNVRFEDLQKGDAILINIDYKGQISSFIPAFVQSISSDYGTLINYNNQGYAQFSNYETLYGILDEQTDNVFRISTNGESQLFMHSSPVVYLYEKGRGAVSVISDDELYNYIGYPMFFHSYRKMMTNIIVYAN